MTASRPGTGPAKVLVVDGNAASRARLETALSDAGYAVAMAPSASFAATMLEWERPDLIVSSASVEDMDGCEFFVLVRRDPATKDTPFLLLAGADRSLALAAREAGAEATITGDCAMDAVIGRVRELLDRAVPAEPPRRADEPDGRSRSLASLWQAIEAAGSTPLDASTSTLQGSLGVMDLTEVTQAIALGGKTGCLIVSLAAGQGAILFESGRVVHAGFQALAGESAFTALVVAAQQETRARFCFNRAERAQVGLLPKTISASVDQLLLRVAASIDEADVVSDPAASRPPLGASAGGDRPHPAWARRPR